MTDLGRHWRHYPVPWRHYITPKNESKTQFSFVIYPIIRTPLADADYSGEELALWLPGKLTENQNPEKLVPVVVALKALL